MAIFIGYGAYYIIESTSIISQFCEDKGWNWAIIRVINECWRIEQDTLITRQVIVLNGEAYWNEYISRTECQLEKDCFGPDLEVKHGIFRINGELQTVCECHNTTKGSFV